MKVAVPIISTNEAELLRHALRTALTQENVEVLVVDNASTDATAATAAEFGVECLRLPERHSYCRAMNVALSSVETEAILFMQPDCFLEPGFVAAAMARLEDPRVGSVAPKLISTEGPAADQRLGVIDAAGMVVDRRRKNGLIGHGQDASAFARAGEPFGADGAVALYRRAALDDLVVENQVFDEDLVAVHDGVPADWGSDADLAWRARLLGWRCVYEPRAVAYHVRRYSPSKRAQVAEWQRTVQFRNRYLMIIKNDPLSAFLRDLVWILPYEVAALGFALLREPFLLRGYREAVALYPAMRRKRTELQRRRKQRGSAPIPYGLEPPA